jgi:hypothetical protein
MKIAPSYEHITMKEFMEIFFQDLKIKLVAMFKPPPGCVQIPFSCFALPDCMGLPGPLGYNMFGLHEGWSTEKVENHTEACGTLLYGRRYHDDGSHMVLPLAQLLVADKAKRDAAEAALGSSNWVVSRETHNSCKHHLSSAGAFLIKGLDR